MKLYQLLILLSFCIIYNCKPKEKTSVFYEIIYGANHCGKKLITTLNNKEQIVVSSEENLNLRIQLQGDFNNDGYTDVLLEERWHCDKIGFSNLGYIGSAYFIISYDGKEFHRSKKVGKDWDGIKMELKDNKHYFTIETKEKEYEKLNVKIQEETFVLDEYDFKLISKKETPNEILAQKEIHCGMTQNKEVYFDVDNYGLGSRIEASYGTLKCYDKWRIYKDWAIIYESDRNVNRIGILKTKTNGLNDIVLDYNEVLKWNGKTYISAKEYGKKVKYRVFAKNGLIIRDKPKGNPIGKFEFNAEIDIILKTNIKYSYNDDGDLINGYWYKTEFIDKNNNKKQGYVFSGYVINKNKYSIFNQWGNVKISKTKIIHSNSNKCFSNFPIQIINKNEIELIWTDDGNINCAIKNGFRMSLGIDKTPEEGKPFAKFKLEENTLKVTYYYPEWVKEYSKSDYPYKFLEAYEFPYHNLID